jgi:hypothetical protein
MYQASVPVFTKMLGNLSAILKKGEEFAAAKKIEPSVLLNARLAADMFPLTRQVQIACDSAKFTVGRISGVEIPAFEDNEASFGDLQARIEKTVAFLKSVPESAIDGTEAKDIQYTAYGRDHAFTGQSYLLTHGIPNHFFHITTAYDILRHNGVDIGKGDFLGNK